MIITFLKSFVNTWKANFSRFFCVNCCFVGWCQNQDIQDERMYRMKMGIFWWCQWFKMVRYAIIWRTACSSASLSLCYTQNIYLKYRYYIAGCGVRGYLLHPLLHTPHSLTLYSALLKIVLPYQDDNNIFKILCQHLKSKFFAVFFALIVALWG